MNNTTIDSELSHSNFIKDIIQEDLQSGKHSSIVTRFPPEPNGYLHIGHAKAICLNFGLPEQFPGRCNLRFDDTNPDKEDTEFVTAIQEDIKWLGFDWDDHQYFASDYYEQLYAFAQELIRKGLAYVCDLSAEETRAYRGTLTEPGKPSPYRDRTEAENLELFEGMRQGKFAEGSRILRAKIDMASPNLNLRDPALYRIKKTEHHRTGDTWCIYPMYDFAHSLSDALEGITHSLCSLEFENHRPLYNWFVEHVEVPATPRQIEFNRLNLYYTVMSKRKLSELVQEQIVTGWDDPRMPTLRGLRRRGYTPQSIKTLCDKVGYTKSESWTELALLEQCIREDLETTTPRVMAILDPLKVTITNYPEGQSEEFNLPYYYDEPDKMGYRKVPFSKTLYIERDDFMEEPVKKFFRLFPGNEVRLRKAYFITCTDVIKDDEGNITEILCTYDPESKGGTTSDKRKVRGTLHWVSAEHSVPVEIREYNSLFTVERPDENKDIDYKQYLNPDSKCVRTAQVEPSLTSAKPGDRFQFERKGYFIVDPDTEAGKLVFNRTVTLKDSWKKILKNRK